MDVWEVPQSSRSGLDRGFLMDVGPKQVDLRRLPAPRRARDDSARRGCGPIRRWSPPCAKTPDEAGPLPGRTAHAPTVAARVTRRRAVRLAVQPVIVTPAPTRGSSGPRGSPGW